MSIEVLPDVVAAQIAAGEVVERPASVVKELVENALDAGATTITVEAAGGGQRLVRVSDDGHGIPAKEAALAFARHSTSKLRTVADLDSIRTLGFRGEALASIAAVSRTTLVTRHRDATTGAEVLVEGGEVVQARPAGAPAGTVVTVENLFFNTPARLKFLKSESTERRHITQLVTHYAMAYPAVRFRLVQEGREQFHSTGSGDLADVLVETFGLEVFRDMLEVSPQPQPRPDLPPVEVTGFASAPDLNRSNRSHIILFVNGRAVADQSLSYAVIQAYGDLLPPRRYPLAVLMIALPPDEVDVNVHPTKAEVRFRAPDAVFSAVQRAVRYAVGDSAPARVDSADSGWGGNVTARSSDGPAYRVPGGGRPRVPGEEQMRLALKVPDPGRFPRPAEGDTAIPEGPEGPARPRTLPILRVVGQVGATYIVAEGPAGLYLLDQHFAHVRVLYEWLSEQMAAGAEIERETLRTVTVEMQGAAARALESALDVLAALGFGIDLFGGDTFRVRAVPALLAEQEPEAVLTGLVTVLTGVGDADDAALLEALIRQVCALGAYRAGEILSFDEMQGLVQQLERCANPLADPDGNPTLVHISGEDLAQQFRRG